MTITDTFQLPAECAYTGEGYLDPLPWQVDQQALDIAAGILDPGALTGTLTGSVLGLAYDTLLGGLLGGLLSLMYLAPMPVSRMAASLAGAALAGGAFAPAAVAAAHQFAPWLASMGPGPLRMTLAIAVGLVAQVAIPAALAALKRKSETA